MHSRLPSPLRSVGTLVRSRTLHLGAWMLVLLLGGGGMSRGAVSTLELVGTWPIEVGGDPGLPAAHDVWRQMIDGATTSVDLAHFYASNEDGSRLETVIEAVERAADRGVRIRFLTEEGFYATYPETLDRLAERAGIEVRRLPTADLLGGVLHAKMMLVDGREAFVGSQNFDWRALEHIVELGVRVRDAKVVTAYADLFTTDWTLAAGTAVDEVEPSAGVRASDFPVELDFGGSTVLATPVVGCATALPAPELWDLPHLLALVDGARRSLRLQALSYSPIARDGSYWPDLEVALRSAAARGVRVEMLLSHWDTRAGRIEHLQSLQCVPGIEVRIATVPPFSGGFLPYARVIHSKLLLADGERAWVGTSNFSRDYFHAGRHAGLLVDGEAFGRRLDGVFEAVWEAEWTTTVDPGRVYPQPRVGE